MKKVLGYAIETSLKDDYDGFIEEKYGHKRNRCGSELSKWIKLGLTVNGDDSYQDDPDVQAMLRLSAEKYSSTHTHHHKDDSNKESSNDDEWKRKMQERIDKLEEQLAEREPTPNQRKIAKEQGRYRDHSMDGLVSRFYDEYGEDQQVTYNDISQLIMKIHGVIDERSIMNRVQYLVASGCIESFAPNVYNIK